MSNPFFRLPLEILSAFWYKKTGLILLSPQVKFLQVMVWEKTCLMIASRKPGLRDRLTLSLRTDMSATMGFEFFKRVKAFFVGFYIRKYRKKIMIFFFCYQCFISIKNRDLRLENRSQGRVDRELVEVYFGNNPNSDWVSDLFILMFICSLL